MPDGSVLDLDSEACISALPAYLVVFKANEISLKFQKPLLTRLWDINVSAMQVMARYKSWAKLFKQMHNSWQGDMLSSIALNDVALGKSNNLKRNEAIFCEFIRA